ncbi:MAG TPA: hypothetical protein VGI22_28820 [Xanthobacteraceae bacterium]
MQRSFHRQRIRPSEAGAAFSAFGHELRIDMRQWLARIGPLRRPLHDGDDTIYLKPNAQAGGAWRKAGALADRPDLLARSRDRAGRGGERSSQTDDENAQCVQ